MRIKQIVTAFFILSNFLTINYAAEPTAPTFVCTLTDSVASDGAPGDAKDTFVATTPKIYLICQSDEVKKGEKAKTVWVADDTNNVAPMNYKIDEKTFDIDQDLPSNQVWTMNASVSKPNNNWPLGSYHVDFYMDNTLVKTIKFSVK